MAHILGAWIPKQISDLPKNMPFKFWHVLIAVIRSPPNWSCKNQLEYINKTWITHTWRRSFDIQERSEIRRVCGIKHVAKKIKGESYHQRKGVYRAASWIRLVKNNIAFLVHVHVKNENVNWIETELKQFTVCHQTRQDRDWTNWDFFLCIFSWWVWIYGYQPSYVKSTRNLFETNFTAEKRDVEVVFTVFMQLALDYSQDLCSINLEHY